MSRTEPVKAKKNGAARGRLPLIERAVHATVPTENWDQAPTAEAPGAPGAKVTSVQEKVPPAKSAGGRTSKFAELDLGLIEGRGLLTPRIVRSRIKEEFRIIKRAILQHAFQPVVNRAMPGNLVMVSSARPMEGKTFTAINLAISIALERDYSVLLIDADFTKPSVLDALGLAANRGLIDVLEDPKVDLSETLIRTNIDKFTLLPAGRAHNLGTEFLASQRMKDVVQEISRRYRDRIVIFDAPPVLSTSEPSTLAMHVGQVVFVIEADKTPKAVVQEALDMIGTGPRVSVVLNRCRPQFGHAQFGTYYRRDT